MEITLRTKSASKLSADATPAIVEVLNWPDAAEHVFTGLHSPEYLAKKLGLNCSAEDATVFANELRYQFTKHFPEEPLNLEVTDGIFLTAESTAFKALSERVTEFVARRILERIHEYSFFNMKAIERAGFLLRATIPDNPSEEQLKKAEKLNFGGLREIFTNREGSPDVSYHVANWLKPACKEISALYDECMSLKYPEFNQKKTAIPAVTMVKTEPSVNEVAKETPQATENLPETNQKEPAIETAALTPEAILANAEPIKHFLAYATKLEAAEVTPLAILHNENAIHQFFAYAKKLRNAGLEPELILQKADSVTAFLKATKTLMA